MKALVTGGGGFLARYIVEKLLTRGWEVVSISRGNYPELEEQGVDCRRGDIRNPGDVMAAAEACDAIFHVAALPGLWGDYDKFYSINVTGTENVIETCRRLGINKLIYTSSPSVVFPMGDLEGVDESRPYPDSYSAPYPQTKAIAEQKVLAANDDTLATCSLRPHIIWGPRDNHIIPLLINRATTGRLIQVGPGTNLVDLCYVENAADAHLLAEENLHPGSPVAGNAYFITDGAPVNMWEWIRNFLDQMNLPPVKKQISVKTALRIAGVLETVHRFLPFLGEPRITRFGASNFATSHYFDISAARRDFGYDPKVDNEEGLKRTIRWFKDKHA